MEIHLDKRAVKLIRLSAQDAIEEGDTEALREDILEAFSEEQTEEIERRLDSADFFEFLTDLLDEWSVDDVDELFELLETQLGELGVDLKYEAKGIAPDEEEEADDVDDDDDEDDDDLDDEEEEEDADEPLAVGLDHPPAASDRSVAIRWSSDDSSAASLTPAAAAS